MSHLIVSGNVAKTDIQKSHFLALAHGGAGPQDPAGKKLGTAQNRLRAILDHTSWANVTQNFASAFLEARLAQGSLAERVGLYVARQLEEDPLFNAGRGASLQGDGHARVSASFIESMRQKFSGVINAENVICPSELAYFLQGETFSVLDRVGASHLARKLKVPFEDIITPERFDAWLEYRRKSLPHQPETGRTGTIGCVAIDSAGRLAAATSTGGVGNETPGRVGDSPTIAGNYCDELTALSCTGIGEQIIAHAVGPRIAIRVRDGRSLKEAVELCLSEAAAKNYSFAVIALAQSPEQKSISWAAGSVGCTLLWGLKTADAIRVCE